MPSEEKIEEFFFKYRYFLFFILIGIIVVGIGVKNINKGSTIKGKDVLSVTTKDLVVEISGEVINPGVYTLSDGSRIEDLIIKSGGVTVNADRDFIDKYVNRAERLIDGKKYYLPPIGWQNDEMIAKKIEGYQNISSDFGATKEGLIDINSASLGQLDGLPGIGQKYGTYIIEHRPYSNIEELVSKGAIPTSVYEKIKSLITCGL